MNLFEIILTRCQTTKGRQQFIFWEFRLESCRNNNPKRSMKQPFSLCSYNNLNKSGRILYIFYYKMTFHDRNMRLLLEPVKSKCFLRGRAKFWFLDGNFSEIWGNGSRCHIPTGSFGLILQVFMEECPNMATSVLFKLLSCVKNI